MIDEATTIAAQALIDRLRAQGLMLATAESCTGGLIAAALTARAGSSDVLECGFVTYSNAAKSRMLGLPAALIAAEGAVSEAVAKAMAEGALRHSSADIAISVTGIAGPGGGSAAKPVGLVYIGRARRNGETAVQRHIFSGDRTAIRHQTVLASFAMVQAALLP